MITNDQKDRDRVLASVIRAQGEVCELPATEAFEQLSRAVQTGAEEDMPFGVVLYEDTPLSLDVRSMWKKFLVAAHRAEAALCHQPRSVFDNVDSLGKFELAPDVVIIGMFNSGSQLLIEAKSTMHANMEDVFV